MKFGENIKMAAAGLAMASGAMDANAEGAINSTPSPAKKINATEVSANLEKEGMYIDNTALKNKMSSELIKNEKAINSLASEIKNQLDNYTYSNNKLMEAMKFKFYTIEAAEEYLSHILDTKYTGIMTIFNDGYSKNYPDLVKLNSLLDNHTKILSKIAELTCISDCNEPVVLQPVVRGADEGERTTVEKVAQAPKQEKQFINANQTKQAELHIDPKHKSKLGYALENLGDNVKSVAKGVAEIFVDDGCNRCGPPGGQVWR